MTRYSDLNGTLGSFCLLWFLCSSLLAPWSSTPTTPTTHDGKMTVTAQSCVFSGSGITAKGDYICPRIETKVLTQLVLCVFLKQFPERAERDEGPDHMTSPEVNPIKSLLLTIG